MHMVDNTTPQPSNTNCASYSSFSKKSKWSDEKYNRHKRHLRKLEVFNSDQAEITDFFNVMKEIRNQTDIILSNIELNPEMTEELTNSETFNYDFHLNESSPKIMGEKAEEIKGLLGMLLESASKNTQKNKFNQRYDTDMKKVALFIFLNCGKYFYEFLHANMKNAIPSVATIYRTLDNAPKMNKSNVNFAELKIFLKKRKLPLRVFISEDQTAIIKRAQYDPETNKLVGFVSPSDENGFPITDKYEVDSLKTIEDAFQNETLCNNSYLILAQPLDDSSPPFCLSLFGSDNRFDYTCVLKRWKYIQQQALQHGITVEGYASDGDTRCLKAMKTSSELPSMEDNIYSPYFKMKFDLNQPVYIQDTVHICTKMKTRLTKPGIVLPMGNKLVSTDPLKKLIETVTKDKHLLFSSYLDNTDKMNFKAADKLCSQRVLDQLEQIQDSESTRQFLKLTRFIVDSFLDKSLSPGERIYKIWYSIFFLRIWRRWLVENKHSIQKNFITLNTYTCIELNGHGILLLLEKSRLNDASSTFLPWLYSSQPCETTFRKIRAMSSMSSTIVNFSLLEMKRRLHRIQVLNDFNTDFRGKMKFPREEGRMGNSKSNETVCLPDIIEVKSLLEKSKNNAIKDALHLGLNISDIVECTTSIDIPDFVPEAFENHNENTASKDAISNNASILNPPGKIPHEEIDDIQNDLDVFSRYENLQLKEYPQQSNTLEKTSPFLTVMINDEKSVTVKKSSLCWLYSEKTGRLSSDRLLRVKGMSSRMSSLKRKNENVQTLGDSENQNKKNKNLFSEKSDKQKQRRTQKRLRKARNQRPYGLQNNFDVDTSTSEEYNSDSSSDCDIFSENNNPFDNPTKKNIIIKNEQYYAVFYDNTWYLGRVIEELDNEIKVKFLEKFMDNFSWPKRDDIQQINPTYIFYGPIKLLGSHPFQLTRHDKLEIEKAYKLMKNV